jgi:RNA polymerase sigma-70 factor (family 1)
MRIAISSTNDEATDASADSVLRRLFEKFFDRLVYFAFKLLKDQDAANDMAQEAFIKYWQVRETVDADENTIKSFLYSTVKNACLNSIRHERVVSAYASKLPEESLFENAVEESMISAEVIELLRSAVLTLPETYRTIGRLAYLEGKKNQEVADELGISVNTVKKQKQKTLELLRLKLTSELILIFCCVYG